MDLSEKYQKMYKQNMIFVDTVLTANTIKVNDFHYATIMTTM